jgi:citrate lyase beta subunit
MRSPHFYPSEIASVHADFSPKQVQIAWVRRMLAASVEFQRAAVDGDGKMVDASVLVRAPRRRAGGALA